MDTAQRILLLGAGLFTVVLGTVHFFLPLLLDYKTVILARGGGSASPHPFRLRPSRYVVSAGDRYGIVWVMNNAASYALVAVGLVDIFATDWLATGPGHVLALAIAGWWLVRAASQLTFGRRVGDWVILAWFAALGALHLWVALT